MVVLMNHTHENRMGISGNCKLDVVKFPIRYDEADLESSKLFGVEHYHAEE